MDTEKKSSSKISLHYGIILGVISILISVAVYAMGMQYEQDWKMGSIGIIAMIAVIFLGIKKFKELNDGYLTIGQALKTGVGIALIGGIISVIYTYVFMTFIEPDFMANTMAKAQEKMMEQNPNLTDEQVEQATAMMSKFSSPAITSAFSLIGSLFFGFIIALISGFIQKNTPNN